MPYPLQDLPSSAQRVSAGARAAGALGLVLACMLAACARSEAPRTRTSGANHASTAAPPVAPRQPTSVVQHGETRVDDYAWLRDKDSPQVLAHLETEAAYTQAVMKPTEALQQRLYREIVARIQETDQSPPVRRGEYVYYSRTEQGKQYETHCRRARHDRCARGGDPRSESNGRWREVPRPRCVRALGRRRAAALLARYDRLPRLHAVRQGPAHRPRRRRAHRPRELGGVGRRWADDLLHGRGPGQAASPAVSPHDRQPGAGHARLRRDRRALRARGLALAQQGVRVLGLVQPHRERGAVRGRRATAGDAHA